MEAHAIVSSYWLVVRYDIQKVRFEVLAQLLSDFKVHS